MTTWKDKSKERAYFRKKYKNQRLKVLTLLGNKCVECGIEDLEVLQIDHIKPIKQKAGIRPNNNKLFKMIIRGDYQIKNLQLLCANHHMKKSYTEHKRT